MSIEQRVSLTDIDYVKSLKGDLRATLETDAGKNVIKFLEKLCGWYDFEDMHTETVLNKNGRRQVLATIKTLLVLTPDQIVALAIEKEL